MIIGQFDFCVHEEDGETEMFLTMINRENITDDTDDECFKLLPIDIHHLEYVIAEFKRLLKQKGEFS